MPQGAKPRQGDRGDEEAARGAPALNGSEGALHFEGDPDLPGWLAWRIDTKTPIFNHMLGPVHARSDGPGRSCVRIVPQPGHCNLYGAVHGGFLLAFLDVALFAGSAAAGSAAAADAVTLELSNQFVSAGRVGEPLEAMVEVTRETRRLIFVRGVMKQGDTIVSSFTGLLSKVSAPR